MSLFALTLQSSAIPRIISGTVEPMVDHYRWDQTTETLRSQAVGFIGSSPGNNDCTGTWIGPTLFMTAAHCDIDPGHNVRMELYPTQDLQDGSPPVDRDLDYTCTRHAATAWLASNADLTLWQCGTNKKLAPGDRHGWVDYSILQHDRLGDQVYSIWGNDVNNPSNNWGWIKLYSEGAIQTTDQSSWAVPNCLTQPNQGKLAPAHKSKVYIVGGGSGSIQLSQVTHTAVIGPTSTNDPSADDPRRFRISSSMRQILNAGDLPQGETYRVETTDLAKAPGQDPLTQVHTGPNRPSTGGGCAQNSADLHNVQETDRDGDRVFDIQERIDQDISNRPIYTLDFNSGWRRALWQTGVAFSGWTRRPSTQEPWQHFAEAQGAGSVLEHGALNLKPNTVYNVRVAYRPAGGAPPKLEASFSGTQTSCDVAQRRALGRLPSGAQFNVTAFQLETGPCNDPAFHLSAVGQGRVFLRSVVIAEARATWDFETWDRREPWRQDGSGRHALMHEVAAASFFAGVATDSSPLQLPMIPLQPCTTYRLRFQAKTLGQGTYDPFVAIEAKGAGTRLLYKQPPTLTQPAAQWTPYAFEFDTRASVDAALDLWIAATNGTPRMAVDDVRVRAAKPSSQAVPNGMLIGNQCVNAKRLYETIQARARDASSLIQSLYERDVPTDVLERLGEHVRGFSETLKRLQAAANQGEIRNALDQILDRVGASRERLSELVACCEGIAPETLAEIQQDLSEIEAAQKELAAAILSRDPSPSPNPTSIEAALDENDDDRIGDDEILSAIEYWVRGEDVPGTEQTIDDDKMLSLIQLWVTNGPIASQRRFEGTLGDRRPLATMLTPSHA